MDEHGQPLVITLNPAMPDYYDPSNRAKAVFIGEPFPEAVCVEISRCHLLAPPCYQSREKFEGQQPFWPIVDPWRVSVRTIDNLLPRGLPHLKLARFYRASVKEWLADCQVLRT